MYVAYLLSVVAKGPPAADDIKLTGDDYAQKLEEFALCIVQLIDISFGRLRYYYDREHLQYCHEIILCIL